MMKWSKKRVAIPTLYISSVGILLVTNPERISPGLLLMPLILLYIAVLWSVELMVQRFIKQAGRKKLSRRLKLMLAITVAFPGMLLLLQSIGQLSLRDVITLVLITVLLGFYIIKAGFGRRST